MDVIRLVIYENKQKWDLFYITSDFCATTDHVFFSYKESIKNKTFGHVLNYEKVYSCDCIPEDSNANNREIGDGGNSVVCKTAWCCNRSCSKRRVRSPRLLLQFNGYELSVFLYCVLSSKVFRNNFIAYLKSSICGNSTNILVKVKLVQPKQHIIDFAWGRRMECLACERMVLSVTMSWLSTLGGAFSALGDARTDCAGVAARISVHQFKIAIRLGDLQTVARCKLYLALSLIQRGKLKIARKIIYEQYQFAKGEPEEVRDIRLIRMCQGMWAKLKYSYKLLQNIKYRNSKEP
ncbi:uncharacterized protein [Hetaerina americana]|uniref:uncharacterized protein n=1 Tax=Hetaerina americana TaxID=62018 RepID=UPI003A7F1668